MRTTRSWLAGSVLVALLAGCASTYQPLGRTGGYEDKQLEKDTFQVSYFGNGNTPRPVVLKYFLYRCAELTVAQGYEYFEIYAVKRDTPQSAIDSGPFLKVRGTYTPPTIVYVPGYTATRWSVTGVIRMYPKQILGDAAELFSASMVMELLGPEVRAGNPSAQIPKALRRVDGKFPVAPINPRESVVPPPSPSQGPVHLDDLKNLLPK
jgi:hypothetical protein